ncbi:MAG: FAD-dependent oxidoreductase [Rhizobiales bacterium]|nr:FAD-dependent oxidoreductase [Hyphomicrobiales bacterium]
MMDTQVAILGAGLAGLNAARLLHRGGIDFMLLEARDRPGGRIFTAGETGKPDEDGFDLGPSWFWPGMQPPIGDLVIELGIPAFGQHSEGDVVFERMSREAPHRFRGMRQEPQSMRLAGGTAAVIRALMRDLPADSLHFGTCVESMRLTENCVELSVHRTDVRETVRAAQVIAAIPPRILAATVQFDPAPNPQTLKHWQGTPTWMAPHAKVFAIYERPFWRDAGFSGTAQSMVGPLAEIHDATTASGRAALFGFIGIGAQQRASLGEDALLAACVEQFVRIFGSDAANPRAMLYKDWAADPLTATPEDWLSVDHPHGTAENWVSGPWVDRLTLAGSETSPREAGYLAGAVEASRRAAENTTKRLATVSTGMPRM